jgi:hypothetical protein
MTSSQPIATPIAEGLVARAARALGYVMSGDAGWFGPLAPMSPQAPADVAGRAFDFPSGYNLVTRPRAYEGTSFGELRALADSYDLIRLIVETRKDQIERLSWTVRARDRAAAAKSDPRVAAIAALFACPDGVHPWTTWLRMVLEDLLVIDAPALYLRRTRDGRLCALEPLDGATIKRVIDDWGRTPAPPDPAYQQVLKGLPAVDYTTDELLYLPRNPRVHKVYGFSAVEQVQMTVSIALRRQIWQLQYYTEGNIPEALIGVPDTWTPDQIRQFQGYWDSLHEGNTAQRRHAKFVPGGVAKTFIPTREPALKDPFDEWLARVVCYAFSVSPQPFVAQVNRATAETAQDAALAEGLLRLHRAGARTQPGECGLPRRRHASAVEHQRGFNNGPADLHDRASFGRRDRRRLFILLPLPLRRRHARLREIHGDALSRPETRLRIGEVTAIFGVSAGNHPHPNPSLERRPAAKSGRRERGRFEITHSFQSPMKPASAALKSPLATRRSYAADLYTFALVGGDNLRYCAGRCGVLVDEPSSIPKLERGKLVPILFEQCVGRRDRRLVGRGGYHLDGSDVAALDEIATHSSHSYLL